MRHKVLDCIGDFYLSNAFLLGRFHGFRSGHALNNKSVRALLAQPDAWEMVSFDDEATAPVSYAGGAAPVS